MKKLITNFLRDESGQALTEYALILAVIAVAVIAVMVTMGDKIKETFTGVSDNLGGATEGGTTE